MDGISVMGKRLEAGDSEVRSKKIIIIMIRYCRWTDDDNGKGMNVYVWSLVRRG